MREQRKSEYNRKLAHKLYDIPIEDLKFSVADEKDIQQWMSPVKQVDI